MHYLKLYILQTSNFSFHKQEVNYTCQIPEASNVKVEDCIIASFLHSLGHAAKTEENTVIDAILDKASNTLQTASSLTNTLEGTNNYLEVFRSIILDEQCEMSPMVGDFLQSLANSTFEYRSRIQAVCIERVSVLPLNKRKELANMILNLQESNGLESFFLMLFHSSTPIGQGIQQELATQSSAPSELLCSVIETIVTFINDSSSSSLDWNQPRDALFQRCQRSLHEIMNVSKESFQNIPCEFIEPRRELSMGNIKEQRAQDVAEPEVKGEVSATMVTPSIDTETNYQHAHSNLETSQTLNLSNVNKIQETETTGKAQDIKLAKDIAMNVSQSGSRAVPATAMVVHSIDAKEQLEHAHPIQELGQTLQLPNMDNQQQMETTKAVEDIRVLKDSALNVLQPDLRAEPTKTIIATSINAKTELSHAKSDQETSQTFQRPKTDKQQEIEATSRIEEVRVSKDNALNVMQPDLRAEISSSMMAPSIESNIGYENANSNQEVGQTFSLPNTIDLQEIETATRCIDGNVMKANALKVMQTDLKAEPSTTMVVPSVDGKTTELENAQSGQDTDQTLLVPNISNVQKFETIQRAQVDKTVMKDSALNVFQPNMIAEPSTTIVAQSIDTQTHYEHAKPDKVTSKTLHLPNTSSQQNIETTNLKEEEKVVMDSALNVCQPNIIAEPSTTMVAQSMDNQTHYEHAKPDKETSKTLHLPNTSRLQNIETTNLEEESKVVKDSALNVCQPVSRAESSATMVTQSVDNTHLDEHMHAKQDTAETLSVPEICNTQVCN